MMMMMMIISLHLLYNYHHHLVDDQGGAPLQEVEDISHGAVADQGLQVVVLKVNNFDVINVKKLFFN